MSMPRAPASAYSGHEVETPKKTIRASAKARRARPTPHKKRTLAGEHLSLTHPPKDIRTAPGTAATARTEPSAKPGPATRSARRVTAIMSIWSANTAMLSPAKSRRKTGSRTGWTMVMLRMWFTILSP